MLDLYEREVQAAIEKLGDRLAMDLYRIPRHVRVYADGAPDAEDTWVGICTLCGCHQVTNLDPAKHLSLPDGCGEGDRMSCKGTVLLAKNWEALLAAYKIGGWEAIGGR